MLWVGFENRIGGLDPLLPGALLVQREDLLEEHRVLGRERAIRRDRFRRHDRLGHRFRRHIEGANGREKGSATFESWRRRVSFFGLDAFDFAEMATERLKFSASLKGVPNAELLKRLRALHQELMEMDQETVDTSSLKKIARELISPALLIHKERGVRAYTACTLVDILRLYAPEAPYTGVELKVRFPPFSLATTRSPSRAPQDIFQFLFAQLKYLTTAKEPHFAECFYLIESFSNVKSIVLICDLECADELMTEIFTQCFDVIRSVPSTTARKCIFLIRLHFFNPAPNHPRMSRSA